MTERPIAILFDLDGTLVDTIELIMQSMEFAFAEFTGRRPTREEWLRGLGIPLRKQLTEHARSSEELDVLIARYRVFQGEHHDAMTSAYAGVPGVLESLRARGHPMGLVTSKYFATAKKALVHAGIADHISVVIGADSTPNQKPHPEPVLTAVAQLNVEPGRAIFVGDSPHDIRAGNAAGVATAAATWGPFPRADLEAAQPTHWLSSIEELPDLVNRV